MDDSMASMLKGYWMKPWTPGLMAAMAISGVPWAVIKISKRPGSISFSFRTKGIHSLADLPVIGTLRAAAPCQRTRGISGTLSLRWDDIRLRKRSRKTGLSMMIVDSSASMRTNDRMDVTKGIVEALIEDLHLRRD